MYNRVCTIKNTTSDLPDFIVFPSGLCFNYADPVIQSGIHWAPSGFCWRLKIGHIWWNFKTEDLKIQILTFEDLKTVLFCHYSTPDMWCLRLKIWTQCSLNLKTQNIVWCAGSPIHCYNTMIEHNISGHRRSQRNWEDKTRVAYCIVNPSYWTF